ALGAGGDQAGGWGFGVEAAVAGTLLGGEDAGLALEAVDGAVGVGLAGEDAGVVDEVAGLEVVGAVGDDVVAPEDLQRIRTGEHRVVLYDVGVLVQALDHLLGGVDLEHTDGVLGVDDLALQIRFVDDVEVDEAEGAHPGGGEVEGEGGAEASGADGEDPGGLELLLAFHADLGEEEVAGVAGDLFVGQLGEFGRDFVESGWHDFLLVGETPSPVTFLRKVFIRLWLGVDFNRTPTCKVFKTKDIALVETAKSSF